MRHIILDKETPLVSIIVPCYNAERWVGQTLDSLTNQMLRNIEIVVVNDGSTDNSEREIKRFFFDRRIRYVTKENGGTGSALNLGHSLARGIYATWCSADNIYLPDFSATLVAALEQFKRQNIPVEFVYSDFMYIDANGRKLQEVKHNGVQPKHDLVNGYDLGISFMYTMDLWRKTGLYWQNICEDYQWAVRAAQHTNFGLVPKVLAAFRVHGQQITGSDGEREKEAANECKRLAAKLLAEGAYNSSKSFDIEVVSA